MHRFVAVVSVSVLTTVFGCVAGAGEDVPDEVQPGRSPEGSLATIVASAACRHAAEAGAREAASCHVAACKSKGECIQDEIACIQDAQRL